MGYENLPEANQTFTDPGGKKEVELPNGNSAVMSVKWQMMDKGPSIAQIESDDDFGKDLFIGITPMGAGENQSFTIWQELPANSRTANAPKIDDISCETVNLRVEPHANILGTALIEGIEGTGTMDFGNSLKVEIKPGFLRPTVIITKDMMAHTGTTIVVGNEKGMVSINLGFRTEIELGEDQTRIFTSAPTFVGIIDGEGDED